MLVEPCYCLFSHLTALTLGIDRPKGLHYHGYEANFTFDDTTSTHTHTMSLLYCGWLRFRARARAFTGAKRAVDSTFINQFFRDCGIVTPTRRFPVVELLTLSHGKMYVPQANV